MKTKLFVLIFLLLNIFITAQNINGRFSSAVYAFERFDTLESFNYARTFQALAFNINYGKFSLRTRFNYETDLSQDLIQDGKMRFYNLYIEGRNLFNFFTFKLGRISLFNTIASGTYDGGSIKFYHKGYALSFYGGGNVPAYQKLDITDDFKTDYVFGGKLDITELRNFRFVLSYIDKNYQFVDYTTIRLDEKNNPMVYEIANRSNQYKYASGEISYSMKNVFNVYTRYDYDLDINTTSRFEITGKYRQLSDWNLYLYYRYREPRVRYNSIFAVFNYGNTQEIEVGADYKINEVFTVVGKFANVEYKDDSSQRVTVALNSNLGTISYRKTFGYAGELDAISIYSAYSFLNALLTPSLGLAYTSYKLSPEAETNSTFSILAGLNYRPLNVLSFDLQYQYLNNKIYNDDARILFKLNYWFNVNFN